MPKYLVEISRSLKSGISTGGSEVMLVREGQPPKGLASSLPLPRTGQGCRSLAGWRAGVGKENENT